MRNSISLYALCLFLLSSFSALAGETKTVCGTVTHKAFTTNFDGYYHDHTYMIINEYSNGVFNKYHVSLAAPSCGDCPELTLVDSINKKIAKAFQDGRPICFKNAFVVKSAEYFTKHADIASIHDFFITSVSSDGNVEIK